MNITVLYEMNGRKQNQCFKTSQKRILIGRGIDCDIQVPIDDTSVARHHCILYVHGSRIILVNLSIYGIHMENKFLNGFNEAVELHSGEVFFIGTKSRKFQILTD